jgi:excisionase family DNA binding protein
MNKGQSNKGPVCREDDRGPEKLECLTYSVDQASKLLGIGRSSCYNLCASGDMPGCKRLGGRYLISRRALREFIEGDVEAVSQR